VTIRNLGNRLAALENLSKFSSSQVKLTFLDGSTRVVAWKDRDRLRILIAVMDRMGCGLGNSFHESQSDSFLNLLANAVDADSGTHRSNLLDLVWQLAVQSNHFRDCGVFWDDLTKCGPRCVWKQIHGTEPAGRENDPV
jgi:hypothetical protein